MFVKNDFIMAPKLEFEPLESGADMVHVNILVNHGEKQDENRKLRVYLDEIVIAAFIDENELITERSRIGHGTGGFVAKSLLHPVDGGKVDKRHSATGHAEAEVNSRHVMANG